MAIPTLSLNPFADERTCATCSGKGLVTQTQNCSVCGGSGTITDTRDCPNCENGIMEVDDIELETQRMFETEGNFPGCISFNAGRLCFGGSLNEPNRIYMSRAPDSVSGEYRYTDFTPGANPADSIVIEKNDMHGSRVQWIAANRFFLAATERATWSDDGAVPTPSTFNLNIVEYAGSNNLQPRGTKEIMVYTGRGGTTLRALVWNQGTQGSGFIDLDISDQAAHLFSSGISEVAVSDFPFPVLWIVTNNGELISCTINVSGGVKAFARHITDGKVESVAVTPQKTGDIIFIVVNRGSDENPMRAIEHIIVRDLVNDDFSDSHYVDAGEKRLFTEPTDTILELERFEGKEIAIFADGAIEPPVIVSNGNVKLQGKFKNIHLGLPIKSVFSHSNKQIPANGTSLGKKRRIEKVTLKLHKSLGGSVGTTEDEASELLHQRLGSYVLGSAPDPFTGEIDVTVSGNIDTKGDLIVTHNEPVPFTMLALVERVAILEV